MRLINILLIGAAVLMLVLLPSIVSAEGSEITKTDSEGDVAEIGSALDHLDDIDMTHLSASIGDANVTVVLTVKGDIVQTYEDDGTNSYKVEIELTYETNGPEITVQFVETGMAVVSLWGMEVPTEGDGYEIDGGTITVEFDKTLLGTYTELLDLMAETAQSSQATGGMGIDYIEKMSSSDDDDDTSDDDTSDDDASDDDTLDDDDEDSDSPGPSFYLITLSMIVSLLIFGYRKRRD